MEPESSLHRLRADCSPLSTGALYGRSQRVTIPDAVKIQFWPPEDEHSIARNMSSSPLSTGALYGRSQRVTIPNAVKIQFWPPEDEHSIARNMSRYLVWYIYYRTKKLCIKLLIKTSSVWNISHSKKNWARYYYKCDWIFVSHILCHCQILMKPEFPDKFLKKSNFMPSSMRTDRPAWRS
jgi:virulence-associated protein VagC